MTKKYQICHHQICFFFKLRMHQKSVFGPGFCSPRLPSRLGSGIPPELGTSVLRLPSTQIPGYTSVCIAVFLKFHVPVYYTNPLLSWNVVNCRFLPTFLPCDTLDGEARYVTAVLSIYCSHGLCRNSWLDVASDLSNVMLYCWLSCF